MTRAISFVCLLCLTLSASAQQLPNGVQPAAPSAREAARDAARWRRVEQLAPGQPILLLERGSNRRFTCGLDLVDDTMLACISFGSAAPPQRIVYLRSSLERVWTIEHVSAPSGWWRGIAAVFSGLVVAGRGAALAAVPGAVVGFFAGVGGALAIESRHNYGTHEILVY